MKNRKNLCNFFILKLLTFSYRYGIMIIVNEREVKTMKVYLIEIAIPTDIEWTLEKVRANSLEEAKAELLQAYGTDAFFGYAKAL